MAATYIKEKFPTSLSSQPSGITTTRVFDVVMDDINDGPLGAQVASVGVSPNEVTIPKVGEQHSLAAPYLTCKRVRATGLGTGYDFEVTCEYDTKTGWSGNSAADQGTPEWIENPLSRPWAWSQGARTVSRIVNKTLPQGSPFTAGATGIAPPVVGTNVYAITNSAGDAYVPGITETITLPTLTVTRPELPGVTPTTYNFGKATLYNGMVATDEFNGWPAETTLLDKITASIVFESGLWYANVTYEFMYNDLGWQTEVLDRGLRVLKNGQPVPATNDKGVKAANPVLLNGSGVKLPDGFPVGDPSAPDPVFGVYVLRKRGAFAPFGLL